MICLPYVMKPWPVSSENLWVQVSLLLRKRVGTLLHVCFSVWRPECVWLDPVKFWILWLLLFVCFETGSHSVTQAGVAQLTVASTSWAQAGDPPISASQVTRTTGVQHHTQLIFKLSVEMRLYCVAQACLKLLGSRNPPASDSQSAEITGVSHWAWPSLFFYWQWPSTWTEVFLKIKGW